MTDHLEEARRRMRNPDEAAAAKFPVHFALAHVLIDVAVSLRKLSGRGS